MSLVIDVAILRWDFKTLILPHCDIGLLLLICRPALVMYCEKSRQECQQFPNKRAYPTRTSATLLVKMYTSTIKCVWSSLK